jgi:hypothetical protein
MGLKDIIHSLHRLIDLPILITEELHQNFSIEGLKKKPLALLVNTFGAHNFDLVLDYKPIYKEWELKNAGQISAHVNCPFTIPLRLLPALHKETAENYVVPTTEQSVVLGIAVLRGKYDILKKQFPDDYNAVCELLGRLKSYYPTSDTWEWFMCPRAGTTLNFHLQPNGPIDPAFFLIAQKECRLARISTIQVYPCTIEIVFHAFSKIERLPYNRRRQRFAPY